MNGNGPSINGSATAAEVDFLDLLEKEEADFAEQENREREPTCTTSESFLSMYAYV